MLRSLRSLLPFILASFGFTLIALTIKMPLFDWQISEIATDLPPEVHINTSWTTKPGESLQSDSYILNQVVILLENGNRCSPEQLNYAVRRSRSDMMIEQIALNVNQRVVLWLTGLTFTGQITIGVILLFCGMHIWWFTIWYKRPFSETIIFTVIAVIMLGFLTNVWRILVPDVGVFVCRPGLHGTLTFDAVLSKTHYETLIVFLVGICLELGAIGIMWRQIIRTVIERKEILINR